MQVAALNFLLEILNIRFWRKSRGKTPTPGFSGRHLFNLFEQKCKSKQLLVSVWLTVAMAAFLTVS
jgi:hypothetical protein